MIQFLSIVIILLIVTAVIATMVAKEQIKRAEAAEKQCKLLHEAFWQVIEKAERLQKALDATTQIGREADAERKELAQTLDSDLVTRANNLFK